MGVSNEAGSGRESLALTVLDGLPLLNRHKGFAAAPNIIQGRK